MTDESDVWLDIEGKSLVRSNADTVSGLNDDEELSDWNHWVAKDLSQEDWLVVQQGILSYALPEAATAYLGDELVSGWNGIVEEICTIHNQAVGMRVSRASVVFSGDERIVELNKRLRSWADAYLQRRLPRIAHRNLDTVGQFDLLYREFVPLFEKIAFRSGSANRCFLADLPDYFSTQLFLKTIRPLYKFSFDSAKMTSSYQILRPEYYDYLRSLVELYRWHQMTEIADVAGFVEKQMLMRGAVDSAAASSTDSTQCPVKNADAMRARLESLVDLIGAMRPLLRHNYNPENVLFELTPGCVLAFNWAVGRGIGFVLVASTKAEILVHLHENTSQLSLMIGFDGQLCNFATSWIDVNSFIDECPFALMFNLQVLEAVYERLLSMYDKVNLNAVLASFRKRIENLPGDSLESEPTEQEFAAACQIIAEPIIESLSETDARPTSAKPNTQIKAVRVQRLLTILRDQFDCEVTQGKGSELVIYRKGWHHFTLGHHKRNIYVPVAIIRSLLKHVGISQLEWVKGLV